MANINIVYEDDINEEDVAYIRSLVEDELNKYTWVEVEPSAW